jgi:nitrite reductase/ring-hydroxylating ferredoxin subunit
VTNPPATEVEIFIGTRADFEEEARRIVTVGSTEIGVLLHNDQFFAYENRCVHQGGPVCEGRIIGRVEAVLSDDQTVLGERFSETETHLVCPWHGYEYDLATGECAADRRLRLRSFPIREKGDEVFVVV